MTRKEKSHIIALFSFHNVCMSYGGYITVCIAQLCSKGGDQTYMVMIWDEKKRKKKTGLEDFEANEIPKIFSI
jgi:hypothetical protein